MIQQIHILSGMDKGKIFALDEGSAVILGRSRHADIKFADAQVSRVHCEIQLEDGVVYVTDHDSSGTYINDKKIDEAILQPGDTLQIGDTQMRLVVVDLNAAEPSEPPKPPTVVLPPERLQELVGIVLSHYVVGPVLATGQSGVVFRGQDYKDESNVALKILWPLASSNNREVRRLVRSVRTMLPLKHPNLVALRAAGKTGPYCWIAMELIEGESLNQVIQRIGVAGMLDWRFALRVAQHVGSALEFAHGKQIVHRNITPQNVLVRKSDQQVLLGDLMLAKALEGRLAEAITRPGEMLGDVRYMAPERTAGSDNIDTRSDIYSLGALVYALLTGRPPFDGPTLLDKITKIRSAQPEKPKKYQLAIPDVFEGIVLKMLAKRPEDRYQNATDLLQDLRRVIGQPITEKRKESVNLIDELLACARQAWAARWQEFSKGDGELDKVHASSRNLLQAELEAATKDGEKRVAAWQTHLVHMQKIEKISAEKHQAGKLSEADLQSARFWRLEAVLGLERAKRK